MAKKVIYLNRSIMLVEGLGHGHRYTFGMPRQEIWLLWSGKLDVRLPKPSSRFLGVDEIFILGIALVILIVGRKGRLGGRERLAVCTY